jgi:hypothetical protein
MIGLTLGDTFGDALSFIFVMLHHQHEGLQGRHVVNRSAGSAKLVKECSEFEDKNPHGYLPSSQFLVALIDNSQVISDWTSPHHVRQLRHG